MGMNKVRDGSNMYPFCDFTWNPIRGRCKHECMYCYMREFKMGELRFEEKEMNTQLGAGRFIFVGSSTDMFAEGVPTEWIEKVLEHCRKYPKNTYLFQSKNPSRFLDFRELFPENLLLGTTIETNISDPLISSAPDPHQRAIAMALLASYGYKTMVSIEPIMDFDLDPLLGWIEQINPEFVSIGADSKNHNLPEPPPDQIKKLIGELERITEVKKKSNLNRLIKP